METIQSYPLFKHSGNSDLNSYRPISIALVIVKVFERIIYDHKLVCYLRAILVEP